MAVSWIGEGVGTGIGVGTIIVNLSDRFCALPSGEICVYGIEQIPQMTQIKSAKLARVVCPPAQRSGLDPGSVAGPGLGALGVTFALGLAVGAVSLRFRRR